jgi:hypothetical protein
MGPKEVTKPDTDMSTVLSARTSLCAAAFALILAGCGSSNRLARYDFYEATIYADAPLAAPPDVYTDLAWSTEPRAGDSPIMAALRIGSAVVKEVGAEEARRKLVQAEERVDVPARVADAAMERVTRLLRANEVGDLREADFLVEILVDRQGIFAADPVTGSLQYGVDGRVRMIHLDSGKRVWERKFRERETFARSVGGSPGAIVSGVQLSEMSVEEMAEALERLSYRMGSTVARYMGEDLDG